MLRRLQEEVRIKETHTIENLHCHIEDVDGKTRVGFP